MKKILLATTALAMTTGYAAAELSITATAKIAYGNFGEEHKPGSKSKTATTAEGTVVGPTAEVTAVVGAITADEVTAIGTAHATAIAGNGTVAVADAAITGAELETLRAAVTSAAATVAAEQEDFDSAAAAGQSTTTEAADLLAAQQVLALNEAKVAAANGTAAVAAAAGQAGTGYAYSDTFDLVIAGSGEAGGVAYSASMTIDEDAASNSVGTLSMSTGGFTLAYGADDFGDLVADNANGLEEAAGDIKLSYAANGISASYEMDEASTNPYYMRAGYTNGALKVGLEVADTDGSGAGKAVNTVSLAYTMGALTVSYDADDKATIANDNRGGSDYDAKITYTMGATVLSAGTDEAQSHYAGLSTTIGGLSLTMRTEQDGKKATGSAVEAAAVGKAMATAENELSLSYTVGALTVAYAKDTGDKGKFGDEAETLTTLTYDLGGITIVAKGNDQDETEVSAAFTF